MVGQPSSELHDPSDLTHALQLHGFFASHNVFGTFPKNGLLADFGLLNFMKVGELEFIVKEFSTQHKNAQTS